MNRSTWQETLSVCAPFAPAVATAAAKRPRSPGQIPSYASDSALVEIWLWLLAPVVRRLDHPAAEQDGLALLACKSWRELEHVAARRQLVAAQPTAESHGVRPDPVGVSEAAKLHQPHALATVGVRPRLHASAVHLVSRRLVKHDDGRPGGERVGVGDRRARLVALGGRREEPGWRDRQVGQRRCSGSHGATGAW